MTGPRAADVERLIERAGKVSRCIYIAVEREVADDVSGVIQDLVAALRALGAAREVEMGSPEAADHQDDAPKASGVPGGPPSTSALSPAEREELMQLLRDLLDAEWSWNLIPLPDRQQGKANALEASQRKDRARDAIVTYVERLVAAPSREAS